MRYTKQLYRSIVNGEQTNMEKYKMSEDVLNPKIVGEMEMPKIDLSKYHGTKALITEVNFREGPHGLYAYVKTGPVTGTEDVYATRLLNIWPQKVDGEETGAYGWGSETKTGLFMKQMNAQGFDDLIGREVLVLHELGKNNKQYLTF